MARPLSAYLAHLELRSDLAPEEREALLAIEPVTITVRARNDLVRPKQKVDYACLLADGLLARGEQFADGRRQTSAIYLPGAMADLHSVVEPRASWAITALIDSVVHQVPHEDIKRVAARFPNLQQALWRDTIADASILSKWVTVLSRQKAVGRLAHLICEYRCRMTAAGLGDQSAFALPLTQEQLSEILGITPVHVARVVRELREAEVVSVDRGMVHVRDYDALSRIAEFDPSYLLLRNAPNIC